MYGSQVREHFRYVEQNVCRRFSESDSAKHQHPRCTGFFDYCPKMIKSTDVFEMVNTLATKEVAP